MYREFLKILVDCKLSKITIYYDELLKIVITIYRKSVKIVIYRKLLKIANHRESFEIVIYRKLFWKHNYIIYWKLSGNIIHRGS